MFFKSKYNQNCFQYFKSLGINPKISIIVPVYNTEEYLKNCLESLINQTYKNIEILCIDDGSKDNSLNILQKYEQQDFRIKVFHQNNSGVSAARNIGLKNMTGEYLMFCDSDDYYEHNMCEEMLYTILLQNVDVVCCRAKINYITKNTKLKKRYYNNRNYLGGANLNDKYIMKTNVLLWNKIFKTDIIKKYHICFPNGLIHEDNAFWYMYAVLSKNIYYHSEKLYNYTIRPCSIMRLSQNTIDDNWLGIGIYFYQFLENNNLLREKSDVIYKVLTYLVSKWYRQVKKVRK